MRKCNHPIRDSKERICPLWTDMTTWKIPNECGCDCEWLTGAELEDKESDSITITMTQYMTKLKKHLADEYDDFYDDDPKTVDGDNEQSMYAPIQDAKTVGEIAAILVKR